MRNVFLTLSTNVGLTALGLLTSILLARSLGPLGRGELAAALVWPTMLTWACALGLGQATVCQAAAHPERRRALFANALWTSLIWGEAIGLLAVTLVPRFALLQGMPLRLLKVSLLALPLSFLADNASALLLSTQRFARYGAIRLIAPLVNAACLVGCDTLHHLTPASAIASNWAGSAAALVLMLAFLRRDGVLAIRGDILLMRQCLSYGLRAHLGTLTGLANRRLDQLLMTGLVPAWALGLYAFAVTASEMLTHFSSAVATALFPRTAADPDDRARQARVGRGACWAFGMGCLGAALLWAAAPALVRTVWGVRFLPALPTLDVMLPGVVLMGVADVLGAGLRGSGRAIITSAGELAALAVMLPLLWMLLPIRGIWGAGLASTVGYAVNCLIVSLGFVRAFHATGRPSLLHTEAASIR